MINIIVNNINIPIGNVWYHKKKQLNKSIEYCIKVNLDSIELVNFTESYTSKKNSDYDFTNYFLELEEKNCSLGFIWRLIHYCKRNNLVIEDKNSHLMYLTQLINYQLKKLP